MRAFLGLSPDPQTKLAIQAWRDKTLPAFNAPVPAANFHVTLAFLGQVTEKQLDSICSQIEQQDPFPEFKVNLDHVGYWSKPKAFWLGSKHTQAHHLNLASQLQKIARQGGIFLSKQDYVAHLTLAQKCVTNPPTPLIDPQFSWHNSEFHLFESVSSAHGVAYHIRHSWPLAKRFAWQK